MSGEVLPVFHRQVSPSALPAVDKVNSLIANYFGRWFAIQAERCVRYLDLGLAQVKVSSRVNDLSSFQDFTTSQTAVANFLYRKMLEDSQAILECNSQLVKAVDQLAWESFVKS